MENLNDSQSIGVCVYNIFILGCIGVAMNFLLAQQVTTLYILTAVLIIITTTMTQLVIFGPKVYQHFTKGSAATTTVSGGASQPAPSANTAASQS